MKKTACVTGASGDIGRALAKKLINNGYKVFLFGFSNIKELEALKQEAISSDVASDEDITIVCANLADYSQVEAAFERIPSLDLLVNNAGISYVGMLQDMTVEEWRNVLDTNLSSVFYTSKLAIPKMLQKSEARILNISSVWGNEGASMEVSYSASKAGVNGFTKALAKELAPSHISVNAIACGFIDTKMNAHLDAQEREMLRNEIPADRFGKVEEVADLMLQIVESPTYMTGQIITLDGGWYT